MKSALAHDEDVIPRRRASRDDVRERRCIVMGEVLAESKLVRFVADPDGNVVPDVAAELPGRGMWVSATRAAVATAVAKNLFSKSAKAPLKASADLAGSRRTSVECADAVRSRSGAPCGSGDARLRQCDARTGRADPASGSGRGERRCARTAVANLPVPSVRAT